MSWLTSLESPLSAFWASFLLSYCGLLHLMPAPIHLVLLLCHLFYCLPPYLWAHWLALKAPWVLFGLAFCTVTAIFFISCPPYLTASKLIRMGSSMSSSFKMSVTINFTLCTGCKRACWFLGLPWSQWQFYTHVGHKSMGPRLPNVNVSLRPSFYILFAIQSPLVQWNADTWICFCISPICYLGDSLPHPLAIYEPID